MLWKSIFHLLAGLVYLYLFLPIVVLVMMSFTGGSLTSFPPQGFSLQWYASFWQNRAAWDALQTSVLIALFNALLTVILGVLAAYGLVRFDFPGKKVLQSLIFLPIIVPGIVFGIALLLYFHFIGLPSSIYTVTISHMVRALPFSVMLISTSLTGFNPSLEEAAKDLGAGEFSTFWKITLPLIMPGVISAALVSFTVSFDEFVITFFVSGQGVITLPLFLYSEIRFMVTPEINAISTVVLAISLLMVLLLQVVQSTRE